MKTQMYKVIVDDKGTRCWYDINTGNIHRLNGPAIEGWDGSKFYYQNGLLHRLDGPAVDRVDGLKQWIVNHKFHRLDGPAVEFPDGHKQWWIDGQEMTKEKFLAITKQLKETKSNTPTQVGCVNLTGNYQIDMTYSK